MKNMPDTFSIRYACLQISPFETVILKCFWAIPRNKIGKHTQENVFLIKMPKVLAVFAQDVPYGMKAYVLVVQRAPWTRAAVITVPLFFSPPPHPLPSPRAIIRDARPLGTFENQDSRDGKTRYI